MPDLIFKVLSAEAVPYSASPLLVFKILVENANEHEAIQNVLLCCQIQIEAARRRYGGEEHEKLYELYGEPERWGQTLKSMLWAHANVVVRPFVDSTVADLEVPCTFDFNVAATKYFDGLTGGEIPLCFLFSGSVFYKDANEALQVSQISWEREANYRLPVAVWKEMMAMYYPNSAWLNIRKDVFDALQLYKSRNTIPSWELTFERLLDSSENRAASLGAASLETS